MEDFRAHMAAEGQTVQRLPADNHSIHSERNIIYNKNVNPNSIVTYAPDKPFRLGYFDVMCLVINFMIGTGVFNSHTRVMQGTDSTGAALLLWLAGIVYCLCGTHVYIEYGLNVPRYTIRHVEQSVPRSGGDLNYLQYVFRKPAYRPGTIQLSTCLFGVGFIAFGNMAGNAINFANTAMRASGVVEPNNTAVRLIAIAVATLTCFIHAFSRRGGILLNNLFATVKLSILLLIIIIAIAVGAGGLETRNVLWENTNSSVAFDTDKNDVNGYAHAFLAVIFSFWGFEQPNYILGEIDRPRRKFPIAMTIGVVLICLLYMAVTISYMVVVPKEDQMKYVVAEQFFELTLGRLGQPGLGSRIFNAFIAISSIGNMIVMTYTAARVKQEIAKEGILPFPKFFAQNTDLSLGRVLTALQSKGHFRSLLKTGSWLSPEHHSEKTPVGAFVLHFLSCLILISATWSMEPDKAYELMTTLSVYVINCFFGFFVGLGILILRWKGPPDTEICTDENGKQQQHQQHQQHQQEEKTTPTSWTKLTGRKINPYLSVFCASFFTLCNAWPVITTWIPPTVERMKDTQMPWWLIPTIAWAVIVLGVAWYLGFLTVAKNMDRKHDLVFVVERKPEVESVGTSRGEGLVLLHETTYLNWVGKESLDGNSHADFSEVTDQASSAKPTNYDGTDFAGHFQQEQIFHIKHFDGHHQQLPLPWQGAYQPHPRHPTPTFFPQQASPVSPYHQQQPQHQDHSTSSPYQQQGGFQSHVPPQQPPRSYSTNSYTSRY